VDPRSAVNAKVDLSGIDHPLGKIKIEMPAARDLAVWRKPPGTPVQKPSALQIIETILWNDG
jgi:hypothetical protein